MKIIEAMKKVKANRVKISDLQGKIGLNCAHLSHETSPYDNPAKKISEWVQSCCDISQECVGLLTSISVTNHATTVAIEIGGKTVKKTIAEWIWRRREFAAIDKATYAALGDRGLKEGQLGTSTGDPIQVTIVRNYDAEKRDKMLAEFTEEPSSIDAALEVVNATTDLVARV